MLYQQDPITGDHLVIDGDVVLRLRTRREALEVANKRYAKSRAEVQERLPGY